MKKCFSLFALLVFFLSCFCSLGRASENAGGSFSSCFDKDRNLLLLFQTDLNEIRLVKRPSDSHFDSLDASGLIQTDASSPFLKRDKEGKTWTVWEENNSDGNSIFLVLLENGCIRVKQKISSDGTGTNVSPRFDFDSAGNTWIAWVNRFQDSHRVFVQNREKARTWQVNSSLFSPVFSPRIIIDSTDTVWVFWVSCVRGQDEIIGRSLRGEEWSEEFFLNTDPLVPHLAPEVCLAPSGYPWVVWSAYDGQDYEIWYSFWNGRRWSLESRITDNNDSSDIMPSLAFLPGDVPLVAWSRVGYRSQVYFKYAMGGKWSEAIQCSDERGFNRWPKIACSQTDLAIVWENTRDEKTQFKTLIFPWPSFKTPELQRPTPQRPFEHVATRRPRATPALGLNLLTSIYVGFGDSITYGVLERTWFPDKGYVPRLEILLRHHFGEASVVNRGIPGEQTWEGLARIEDTIKQTKAKYFFLMEGTNDMTEGFSAASTAFNIREIVKKCLQYGVYPLLATIIPRSDDLWNTNIRERTLSLNALVRKISLDLMIQLVDMYEVFMNHQAGYLALFSDGAHPNELGYQIMAESWFLGIKIIPWPPVNLTLERKLNQLLFYEEPLNVIKWEANPLLAAETQLTAYHIYRKTLQESLEEYTVIASVSPATTEYTDWNILKNQIYNYFICAERKDGFKGPASETVSDR